MLPDRFGAVTRYDGGFAAGWVQAWHVACGNDVWHETWHTAMDITTSLAASRLIAQQRAHGHDGEQHRQCQHARLPRRDVSSSATGSTAAAAPGGVTGAGDQTVAYTQDRATWRGPGRGHADPYRQPVRSGADRRRLFHRQTPKRPAADPRRPVRPDAGWHAGRQRGNAVLDTTGQPIRLSPDGYAGYASRAMERCPSENGQLGKIGVVQPTDPMQDAGRGRDAYRVDVPDNAGQPRRASSRARSRNPTSSRSWR